MKIVALLSLIVLTACATGPDRVTVLNGLVGQSETEVVRTLGVPSRSYDTEGRRFIAYREERAQVEGGPLFFGGGYYGRGFGYGSGFSAGFGPSFGYGGGFPVEVIPRVCETTFEVVAGRVAGWSLRGNACG